MGRHDQGRRCYVLETVYDPSNPQLSAYGNVLTNSYCHAWSCTPACLLGKGKAIKEQNHFLTLCV
jgi:hypothetical protein